MGIFPPLYVFVIDVLVFIAAVIHIVSAPAGKEKLRAIIVIVGFYAIYFLLPNDFFIFEFLLVAWILLTGTPMILSRNVMLALLIIGTVLPLAMPVFFFIGFLFYFIVLTGFLFGNFKKLKSKTLATAIKEDLKAEAKEIEDAPGSHPSGKDLHDTYKDFVNFSTKKRQTEKTSLGQITKGTETFLDAVKKIFKK